MRRRVTPVRTRLSTRQAQREFQQAVSRGVPRLLGLSPLVVDGSTRVDTFGCALRTRCGGLWILPPRVRESSHPGGI